MEKRFIELDIIRGFALLAMIFFHLLWNLDYYGHYELNNEVYNHAHYCPILFFILVGVCLVIAAERKTTKQLIFRGTTIFFIGMILTALSLIFIPERPITFGVLHCIGLSILLTIPLLKLKTLNIFPAIALVTLGLILGQFTIENPSLFHLAIGIHRPQMWRYTVDYFPLLPWFGFTLLGVSVGNMLYKEGERQFFFPDLSHLKTAKPIQWFGKHSLFVYLVHQPILAGITGYIVPYAYPSISPYLVQLGI
jgi:uncharacterized membrane protein